MSEWISVKEMFPPEAKVVLLANEKHIDKAERVKLIQNRWVYPSGLFAYSLSKTDIWRFEKND